MLALAMAVVCTVMIATEFPRKKLEARAGVCYVYDVPAKQHLIGQSNGNLTRRNQSSMCEVLYSTCFSLFSLLSVKGNCSDRHFLHLFIFGDTSLMVVVRFKV